MAALSRLLPPAAIRFARYWRGRLLRGGRYALNGLDKKLAPWLDYRGGFFVELGANDGVAQSNTLYLEQRLGWSGVLIEPLPELYCACRSYRSRGGNRIVNAACVPPDYAGPTVEIMPAGLMSTPLGLATDHADIADHLARAQPGRDPAAIPTVQAPARTLTGILDEARAPTRPDFLSLDVEGAELAVLEGLDFGRYRFRLILVECRGIGRLETYLGGKAYRRAAQLTHHDYLFEDARP